MTAEEWRPTHLTPDYEVSDQGRVRSVRRGPGRKVGRIMAQHPVSRGGYLKVSLVVDGVKKKNVLVHRLVGEAFLGPLPEGLQTRHLNGNGLDNRLVNLRYGTRVENMQDAVAHGTHVSLRYKARTHCSNGHEYTPQNTARSANGSRICRRCNVASNIRAQKNKQARREAAGEITPHVIRVWATSIGIDVAPMGRLHDDIKWAYAYAHPDCGWRPTPDPRKQSPQVPSARKLIDAHPDWTAAIQTRVLRAA